MESFLGKFSFGPKSLPKWREQYMNGFPLSIKTRYYNWHGKIQNWYCVLGPKSPISCSKWAQNIFFFIENCPGKPPKPYQGGHYYCYILLILFYTSRKKVYCFYTVIYCNSSKCTSKLFYLWNILLYTAFSALSYCIILLFMSSVYCSVLHFGIFPVSF